MVRRLRFLCGLALIFCAVWQSVESARLSPVLVARIEQVESFGENEVSETEDDSVEDAEVRLPSEVLRGRVLEGAPPTICAARHCAYPPAGPVCAFDAAGTARTFATLCELEAFSCRESTYYAITSLGEC